MESDSSTGSALTIEPFVGYRVWRLVPLEGEPVLASVMSGDPWHEPEAEARCFFNVLLQPLGRRDDTDRHPGQVSPAIECTCGLYAAKTQMAPPRRLAWAVGPVRLWGRVIEGTKGFRAQRARLMDDVQIYLGRDRGCTMPHCRHVATGIWTGSSSFLARCQRHSRGRSVEFDEFESRVDESFRRRYGIGASPAPR